MDQHEEKPPKEEKSIKSSVEREEDSRRQSARTNNHGALRRLLSQGRCACEPNVAVNVTSTRFDPYFWSYRATDKALFSRRQKWGTWKK